MHKMTTSMSWFFLFSLMGVVVWIQLSSVPTTLNDFTLPGSQPHESGQLETPQKCDNCHGGYDLAVEPAFTWRGSMMAQAARDPLFYAGMAIANQDAPESGDLCIRCHSPAGWLEGRSQPTDGSALNNNDRESVQCDFCHKLIKPTALGVNPYPDDADYTNTTYAQDQAYLATLSEIPPTSANGMYVTDASNAKRGPFTDAAARHQLYYSPFHQDAGLCGTCHDVSNPAFVNVNGEYLPNDFDQPSPSFDPYTMFPVERTFSEWLMSAYNTPAGVYAPQFGGNKLYVSTCQDCHMKDVTGLAANKKGVPLRHDLPWHDMTGGNTFIPSLIESLFPGETDPAAIQDGVGRATTMIQKATSMDVTVTPQVGTYLATVRVTNETGHKLPSGYPEGRRIWLNVKAFDSAGTLRYESGAYDPATGLLTHDPDVKIYEIKPGISEDLAPVVNQPAGPSFHFVLNNKIYKDNRIPPRGFTNANFETIQSPPVDYTYADGQYWDDTAYTLPQETARVEVTLFYQTISREYVAFLRDENVTNNWGQDFYDLWNTNGKSAPVVMQHTSVALQSPDADFAGSPTSGTAPLTVSFVDGSLNGPTSWSWTFGDGTASTEPNPTHTYTAAGTYTVSLTATSDFGSDTETKLNYITATELTGTVIHVAGITVTRAAVGRHNWMGRAMVSVVDQYNTPVGSAVGSGFFNAPTSDTKSGTTAADGIVLLTSDKTKTPPSDWCFTVTAITKGGATYDPGHNEVTSACESDAASRVSGDPSVLRLEGLVLEQNYPNPFNPSTEIRFTLPAAHHVTLTVHNVMGQEVATLVDGPLEAGEYTYTWDGSHVASGVYLYRLHAGPLILTKQMTLMK